MHRPRLRLALQAIVAIASAASLSGYAAARDPSAALAGDVPTLSAPPAAPHAKRVVFVSNLTGGIRIYPADIHLPNPPLLGTITTGATRPEGVWIDRKGKLYVVNGANGNTQASLAEYKHGATTPFRTIVDGLFAPGSVAVGADGTVYVNSISEGTMGEVVEYAPGKTKPELTIPLPDPAYALEPGGLAFDQDGNLLAATLEPINNTVHVFKIPPGSSQVTDLGLQGYGGAEIAVDGEGNLYTGGSLYFVAVYAPGVNTPFRTTSQLDFYGNGLTVSRDGALYVVGNLEVAEFAPGADSPTNTINTQYGETLTVDAALGTQ